MNTNRPETCDGVCLQHGVVVQERRKESLCEKYVCQEWKRRRSVNGQEGGRKERRVRSRKRKKGCEPCFGKGPELPQQTMREKKEREKKEERDPKNWEGKEKKRIKGKREMLFLPMDGPMGDSRNNVCRYAHTLTRTH